MLYKSIALLLSYIGIYTKLRAAEFCVIASVFYLFLIAEPSF